MPRILNAYKARDLEACQACGTPIRDCYVIALDTAALLTVGCECVNTLCNIDKKNVERMTRRLRRAERNWRAQTPKPRAGEDRIGYVNRRMAEMENARKAYQEWQAFAHFQRFPMNDSKSRREFGGYAAKFVAEKVSCIAKLFLTKNTFTHCGHGTEIYRRGSLREGTDYIAVNKCEKCEYGIQCCNELTRLIAIEEDRILTEFETQHSCCRYDFMMLQPSGLWEVIQPWKLP